MKNLTKTIVAITLMSLISTYASAAQDDGLGTDAPIWDGLITIDTTDTSTGNDDVNVPPALPQTLKVLKQKN